MGRTAILHIGPMKTGTTSIQAWLRKNRDSLARHGYHFPKAFGSANMSKLSQLADAIAGEAPADAELTERWDKLCRELTALPGSIHSVVISGEMMGQHLRRPAQIDALKRAFDPYVDAYRIILYLRRQDEISVSLFNTRVRQRSTPDTAILSHPMNYAAMLETWGATFGRAALEPRLFERAELVGNDIVTDFAAALGLPSGAVTTKAKVKNQSFNPAAQSFLAAIYDRVSDKRGTKRHLDDDTYTMMIHTLGRHFVGTGHMPARADAEAFVRKMDASNETVRRDWFSSRERLFSDDFTKYPTVRPAGPSPEEVLDVAVTVAAELLAGAKTRDERPANDGDDATRRRSRRDRDEEMPSSEQLWDMEPEPAEGDVMKTPGEKIKGDKVKGEKKNRDKAPGEKNAIKLEPKIVNKTARTLWRMANQEKLEGTSFADRKTQYNTEKETYVGQAKRLLRSLRKDGVEFTMSKDAPDDESDLEAPLPMDDKEPVAG